VYGRRNRGRQRQSWISTISQDLISLNLTPVDVEDRDDWRRRTHVADPHLRDTQPEGERENTQSCKGCRACKESYVKYIYELEKRNNCAKM